jgi:16S rRNA G966 N2-methylase RsmD
VGLSLDNLAGIGDTSGMPTYPGGKAGSGAAHRIINLMPPHDVYIEPFCGSAAVALLKKPAMFTTLLELDPAALDLARGDRFSGQMLYVPAGGRWSTILGDGLDFLEHHRFNGTELVYCDPPYMRSTRKSAKDLYNFEWTDEHHARLLWWATHTRARVIISGYNSPAYEEELITKRPLWSTENFQAMTRRGPATETLWWNFPRPTVLHDDRYLGDGFRERERIRRQQSRWKARLQRMDATQRNALLRAISDLNLSKNSTLG